MQNQGMPEQIAMVRIKGTIKGGGPRKIWKDELEEDLNIMGIKKQAGNGQIPMGSE
jgi:hypothetical protein